MRERFYSPQENKISIFLMFKCDMMHSITRVPLWSFGQRQSCPYFTIFMKNFITSAHQKVKVRGLKWSVNGNVCIVLKKSLLLLKLNKNAYFKDYKGIFTQMWNQVGHKALRYTKYKILL